MILIICSILFCLILLDFTIIGFLPKILRIWPPLKELCEDKLIEDSAYYSLKTDIRRASGNPIITSRINYKSIILTSKNLIVKNTFLTYLLRINIESIDHYHIKKHTIGKTIILYLTIEGKKKFFQFRSKKTEVWVREFDKLGIVEK